MIETGRSSGLYFNGKVVGGRNVTAGNARERAFLIIRDKIIYMDLKPGEPVSDKLLAEQLGMSRTPVREALILLSAYNMVVLKPQSGTFVAPIDSEQVAIEQFSRYTMEAEIVKQACRQKHDQLALAYEENIKRFEECDCGNHPDRIRILHDLDNDFHGLTFEAMRRGNSFRHMHGYMQHIERLRVLTLKMEADKTINQDHRDIARAVLEGDEQTALKVLEKHLSFYQQTLKLAEAQYPDYFILG